MKAVIGLASDHAGFEVKEHIKRYLEHKGIAIQDFGTHTPDSTDYADYAHPLALAIEAGECERGIAVCGTGNGISMTLNKHQNIRAALCWNIEIAALARQHNDANILVMPGRYTSMNDAEKMVTTFLTTEFEGGRHKRRIEKMPVGL